MVKKSISEFPPVRTADQMNRRDFVMKSATVTAAASVYGAATIGAARADNKMVALPADAPLRDRAARTGFYFGAAVLARQLQEDKPFREAIARECNVLVHENELKWAIVQGREGAEYDFRKADYIVDFAEEHGMLVRGLPLVWHVSIPKHVKRRVNKSTGRDIMVAHIEKLAKRYAGRMQSWDVVNEGLKPADGRPDGLRQTFWLDALGPEYFDIAFETAAKADPNALLIYNDHALTYGREKHDQRRTALINLVKRLQGNGIPIHGIGFQAHLSIGRHPFDGEKFVRFLDDIAELGLRAYFTEMDVRDNGAPADIKVRDQLVADEYKRLAELFVNHPASDMIITWGLSDKYTWINEYVPRLDGLPQRSLPLDHKMRRKESWHALAAALDQRKVVNEF